ncbi:MAG: sulfotransferase, partial [Schleiferiaceae bacterium]|nr:sulfotransferase [Schleiferiaceae bacterium]
MDTPWKKALRPALIALGRQVVKRRYPEPPIFIGGCGRSGTTLLLSILSAHPQVKALPRELGLFNELDYEAEGRPYSRRMDRLYWALLQTPRRKGQRRFCEKSPNNIRHIEALENHYGDRFRLVHIIRDGRDVVLSRHPRRPDAFWVSPERWVADVKAGWALREHPAVHTLFYEDLVQHYAPTVAALCHFLGLPYTREMENWLDHATVRQNRAYQGRSVQALQGQSVGKWQQPENQARYEVFKQTPGALALLEELGYN